MPLKCPRNITIRDKHTSVTRYYRPSPIFYDLGQAVTLPSLAKMSKVLSPVAGYIPPLMFHAPWIPEHAETARTWNIDIVHWELYEEDA